jgi:hypothetical protein
MTRKSLQRGLAVAVLALFALRIWSVSQSWQDYSRWFAEFRRASTVIDRGSRLLIVQSPIPAQRRKLPGVPPELAIVRPELFAHMGALAVIDRSAFFPYLFTQATPLGVTGRNEAVAQTASDPIVPRVLRLSADPRAAHLFDSQTDIYGQLPYWRDWPRTFDYVLWIDFGNAPKHELKQLKPEAVGSFFTIYRVLRK